MYESIVYEVSDPVALIRLNRPEQLNAFTMAMLGEIRDAVRRAEDDPSVVGIVITGTGRGFSAGLDASTLAGLAGAGSASRPGGPQGRTPGQGSAASAGEPDRDVPGLFTYLLAVAKPVVAAVNGVAAGGGMVLALMADVRFASTDASFTAIFSKRGLIAEHGTSWILPRLVGPGRALDLLWTSRRIQAEEAHRTGLVEYLAEPDDLVSSATGYVRELAETASPASLRDTKRLVYRHLALGYEDALREADALQWASMDRFDALEGARAFLERRPPKFPRLG